MKRAICIALAVLLVLSIAGCAKQDDTERDLTGKDLVENVEKTETPAPETEAESEEPEASEETPEAEETQNIPKEYIDRGECVSTSQEGVYSIGVFTDGTCMIKGYTGDEEELEIPSELEGKTVTEIGEAAFSENVTLKSITIPSSVERIRTEAFYYCENIESVSFSEGLLKIDERAFCCCFSLKAAILPDSLKTIGGFAFKACDLRELKLPGEIEKIEHCTFAGSSNLTQVDIPESVESIGAWAFAWTAWEEELIAQGGEWVSLGNGACYIYNGTAEEVTVPAGYKNFEFYGNTGVKKIVLMEGLEEIPGYSCEGMTGLQEIVIPSSIKTIGECAFRNTRVGELTFAEGLESIGPSAFESSGDVILHLPDSVSFIDEEAFINCGIVVFICSEESYAMKYAVDHEFSRAVE